jgi:hypothetical protein
MQSGTSMVQVESHWCLCPYRWSISLYFSICFLGCNCRCLTLRQIRFCIDSCCLLNVDANYILMNFANVISLLARCKLQLSWFWCAQDAMEKMKIASIWCTPLYYEDWLLIYFTEQSMYSELETVSTIYLTFIWKFQHIICMGMGLAHIINSKQVTCFLPLKFQFEF